MGYKRFAHIDIDYDMDNLRDLPRFQDMIKSYREKAKSTAEVNQNRSNSQMEEIVSEIPFTKEDGICKVKCNINGLPLHFVFDTGASTVSLSMVEATFMMKNDFLSEKDVIGSQHFLDANGNVSVGTVINLRKVDFGGLELTNVRASVVRNQKAPLLLGQSVLGRLGKIEIDNSKHVLRISRQ
jgi:clan AA aspartic protease (TIGR02281 family)